MGFYNQLWLIERSPISAFFEQQKVWPTTQIKRKSYNISQNAFRTLFKPKHWILHGLWPSRSKGNSPIYCLQSAGRYSKRYIEDFLRRRLTENWPSYTSHSDVEDIWEHQWNKHGTCSADRPFMRTVPAYFNKVLDLYSNINIGSIFEENNIFPGSSYPLQLITEVLRDRLQTMPYIKCILSETTEPISYLLEVGICFSKGMNRVNCERHGSLSCYNTSTVFYPTLLEDENEVHN